MVLIDVFYDLFSAVLGSGQDLLTVCELNILIRFQVWCLHAQWRTCSWSCSCDQNLIHEVSWTESVAKWDSLTFQSVASLWGRCHLNLFLSISSCSPQHFQLGELTLTRWFIIRHHLDLDLDAACVEFSSHQRSATSFSNKSSEQLQHHCTKESNLQQRTCEFRPTGTHRPVSHPVWNYHLVTVTEAVDARRWSSPRWLNKVGYCGDIYISVDSVLIDLSIISSVSMSLVCFHTVILSHCGLKSCSHQPGQTVTFTCCRVCSNVWTAHHYCSYFCLFVF